MLRKYVFFNDGGHSNNIFCYKSRKYTRNNDLFHLNFHDKLHNNEPKTNPNANSEVVVI